MPDMPTRLQDSARTWLPQGHHAGHHTQKIASNTSQRRGDGMWLETQNYGGRPAERVGPVERCKRHGSQRKMGQILGSMGSSEITGWRKGKRKEEEIRHKGGSWSSSWRWQGQRSRLCTVRRRQQSGSTIQTFTKGAQESQQGRTHMYFYPWSSSSFPISSETGRGLTSISLPGLTIATPQINCGFS